jgi:hypothetical protein
MNDSLVVFPSVFFRRYATRSTTRQLALDNNVRTTTTNAPKSPTKIPTKVPTSPGREKPSGVGGGKSEHHTASVQARLPKSSSKHLINSSQPSTVTVHASTVRTTKASRLRAAASGNCFAADDYDDDGLCQFVFVSHFHKTGELLIVSFLFEPN